MNDFISYDLVSDIGEEQIYAHLAQALTEFAWRRGDSDAQGPYISGRSGDSVQIKLWLGEKPIAMSVSFRGAWRNEPDRENRKQQLIDLIKTKVIPLISTSIEEKDSK